MADKLIDVPGAGVIAFPDSMSDADIVSAIQKNHQEWAQTSKAPVPPPMPPGPTPQETGLAGYKSFGNEVINQVGNQLEGAGKFIAHPIDNIVIPAVKTGAAVVRDIVTGNGSSPSDSLPARLANSPTLRQAVTSTLQPITVSARGAGAVVAPEHVTAPTDEEFKQASEAAGANMAGTLIGEAVPKAIGAVKGIVDDAKVRSTKLANVKSANPASFQPSAEYVGKAFNERASTEAFDRVNKVFDQAASPLSEAAPRILGGPIENTRELNYVGERLLPEIYGKEIAAPIAAIPEEINGAELAGKIKSQIPSWYSDAEKHRIIRDVDSRFNRPMSALEVEEQRKMFNAANRINLAMNNYEQAAVDKLPKGHMLNVVTDTLTNTLADAVKKVDPNIDLHAALSKYGNVTDLIQRSKGKIPIDPSVMDLLTGHAYITGTSPNLIGRSIQAITEKWTSNDAYIKKAFKNYKGPVQIQEPAYTAIAPKPLLALPPAQSDVYVHPSAGPLYGQMTPQQVQSSITRTSAVPGVGIPLQDITQRTAIPFKPQLTSGESNPVGEYLSKEEYEARQKKQISGSTPLPDRQVTSGPFRFSLSGNVPTKVMEGSIAATPEKIAPGPAGRRSNTFPVNWQLDSTIKGKPIVDGEQTVQSATGPGKLSTTDPKVVESTIASIQRYINESKPRGQKLAELQATRDDLVKQLRQYRAQRGAQ